jgi:hypothetical protein
MGSRSRVLRGVLAAAFALAVAACGSQSSMPAPSPVTTSATPSAPASVGATINGTVTVTSAPTAGSSLHAATSYSIVVSVVGTSLSTACDGAGHFKLTGVPSGTVELKFSGTGVQGSVTLAGVNDADDIAVSVTLSTSGAAIDTQERDGAGVVELEGRIAALDVGGASNTILVDSTTVSVPGSADIRHGDTPMTFAMLQVGDRVHVRGVKNGQVLVADLVIDQNDNTSVPVNVTGAVLQLISGFACPAIRFTVEGWTVEADASTSFEKGTCSSIAKGTSVHVKGTVEASGRVLATWIQIGK